MTKFKRQLKNSIGLTQASIDTWKMIHPLVKKKMLIKIAIKIFMTNLMIRSATSTLRRLKLENSCRVLEKPTNYDWLVEQKPKR